MTALFAWTCAAVAALATLGAAYFFDRSAEESIEKVRRDAEIKTASLEHATEQLRESNKKLDIDQERLKEQNLKLSIELEKARTAHRELEAKLSSRSLEQSQKEAIIDSLRGRNRIGVKVVRLGDREANDFATSLISTFQAAGIDVVIQDTGMMAPPVYGLRISPGAGFDPLVEALTAGNIQFQLGGLASDRATVIVGLKPPQL
ncbi:MULTISPECIES: hypothetical protein [unclassified Afipia]|uniref:hypothetical protein n=1 Tax=unclassified Afipia TaxID=2642050 RepID=UPI0004652B43|nr:MULTISPECIES: hypothetical protein [unclassified Afipia]